VRVGTPAVSRDDPSGVADASRSARSLIPRNIFR
jgi:hypothetical protein